jgi:hypothetical protein
MADSLMEAEMIGSDVPRLSRTLDRTEVMYVA